MENNLENLTIGVFAKAAGVNVETIRFYQRKGLLPEPDKPYGSIGRGSGEIREIGTAAGVQSGRDCRAVAARRWHPLRGGQQPGRTQAQGRAREDGRLGAHGNRAV
ncbi:transcriptional regulator MerR [Idiomarina xiamenensis 10-D-4]|uniref:Transcriptional regulator MerR n=1 Tax=Idiomarina xiamenensis 10-D-4 TaxID=740709 RepID=K2KCG9_9GAMM|nr:transcriptional regulator MerR [Idiomarina xiamenensis 10-D-4]